MKIGPAPMQDRKMAESMTGKSSAIVTFAPPKN